MEKINCPKIKQLLIKRNKKQCELAQFLEMDESSLSLSLNKKRSFPMKYVFKLALFFEEVNPQNLIESVANDESKSK